MSAHHPSPLAWFKIRRLTLLLLVATVSTVFLFDHQLDALIAGLVEYNENIAGLLKNTDDHELDPLLRFEWLATVVSHGAGIREYVSGADVLTYVAGILIFELMPWSEQEIKEFDNPRFAPFLDSLPDRYAVVATIIAVVVFALPLVTAPAAMMVCMHACENTGAPNVLYAAELIPFLVFVFLMGWIMWRMTYLAGSVEVKPPLSLIAIPALLIVIKPIVLLSLWIRGGAPAVYPFDAEGMSAAGGLTGVLGGIILVTLIVLSRFKYEKKKVIRRDYEGQSLLSALISRLKRAPSVLKEDLRRERERRARRRKESAEH